MAQQQAQQHVIGVRYNVLMQFRKFAIPVLLFVFVSFLYIHNLSRSVYGGDVGDLITAAFVGGVAHPSGYPLFVFLGFLLTRIHFFPSPAFAVGLISALSGSWGVVFFYLTIKQMTKSILISVTASLILAFSYFFWFYSEIAEVFALHSFFLILLLYLTMRIREKKSLGACVLFFFTFGLSLTNHSTMLLAVPSLFMLLLQPLVSYKNKLHVVFVAMVGSFAGLMMYLYIPIASSFHPLLNWDNVHDIPSFFHLVLRQDYGTFSAGLFVTPSLLQRVVIVKSYILAVLFQLTIPVLFLCGIGFLYLWNTRRLFAISMCIGFLLSGPLFIGYAGFPLTGGFYFGVNERFFLLSIIFLLYFFPFGLLFLSQLFKKYLHRNSVVLQMVFLIIPLMLFFYNYPKTNLSHVFIGDTYGEDVLRPLPPNALVFTAGDTIIFNTWYMHYVVGMRPDVHVLNINGNIGSPYYSVLENQYLSSHPHATSREAQENILETLPQNGSVFSVEELQPLSKKKFTWIPYGLLFQLISPDAYPSESDFMKNEQKIWHTLHVPYFLNTKNNLAFGNLTIADIPNSYANAMVLTGNFYLSQYHDRQQAKDWYMKALTVAPDYEKIYSSLGVYYLSIEKQCTLAQSNFQEAIALSPVEPLNYFLLYVTDASCLHETKAAEAVKIQFEKQFQISFTNAFTHMQQNKK